MSIIENTITINKKQLYYQLLNPEYRNTTKPMLVFLHEGLGSVAQWKDFPALLSQETQCAALVYDRYGYGQSEAFNEIRNEAYFPDEAYIYLPELLEKTGVTEKIILVGHSDGGTIALLYASRFPDNTMAVISEADHVMCEEITQIGVRNIAEEYEKGGLKKLLFKFHHDKTDAMFYSWSKYWLSHAKKTWSIEKLLPLITSPVLAIQGKDDVYGSVKQLSSKLEKINGHVEILFLPHCGHVPHYDTKAKVLQKMKAFILNLLTDN